LIPLALPVAPAQADSRLRLPALEGEQDLQSRCSPPVFLL